jgi:hypothetical protein
VSGQIVIRDIGGWISGPSLSGPHRSLPALMRLIRATETWAIEYHPEGPNWSAERAEGTAIRYLAASTTTELADLIDAAEQKSGQP